MANWIQVYEKINFLVMIVFLLARKYRTRIEPKDLKE